MIREGILTSDTEDGGGGRKKEKTQLLVLLLNSQMWSRRWGSGGAREEIQYELPTLAQPFSHLLPSTPTPLFFPFTYGISGILISIYKFLFES